ncbi:spore coat protein [Bacillus gaemokensis]|nr:spore coat protein [Bacillus gaemokensis]
MPNMMPMMDNNQMPNIMPMMDNNQMPNMMPMMDNNQMPNIMPQQIPMPYQPQMMPQQYPYHQVPFQQQNPYYNMPYPQGQPMAPQYTSIPNIMPMMDNNMPPQTMPEEDCGCGEERALYSPQPGGPHYPNSLYYPTPQAGYAPQPGAMYYQPDPPDVFGTPLEEDEE